MHKSQQDLWLGTGMLFPQGSMLQGRSYIQITLENGYPQSSSPKISPASSRPRTSLPACPPQTSNSNLLPLCLPLHLGCPFRWAAHLPVARAGSWEPSGAAFRFLYPRLSVQSFHLCFSHHFPPPLHPTASLCLQPLFSLPGPLLCPAQATPPILSALPGASTVACTTPWLLSCSDCPSGHRYLPQVLLLLEGPQSRRTADLSADPHS